MQFLATQAFLVIIATPTQAAEIHKIIVGVFTAAIAVAAITLALSMPAAAASGLTGNQVLPYCGLVDSNSIRNSDEGVGVGACLGVVSTLMSLGSLLPPKGRFCPPKDSTTAQGVSIVVKTLKKNPEILHNEFEALAHAALMTAWPCGAGR